MSLIPNEVTHPFLCLDTKFLVLFSWRDRLSNKGNHLLVAAFEASSRALVIAEGGNNLLVRVPNGNRFHNSFYMAFTRLEGNCSSSAGG